MKHQPVPASAPYCCEIVYLEPHMLAARLRGQKGLVLLESVNRQEHLGRYSFLACNPRTMLTVENGRAFLDGAPQDLPPLKLIDRLLSENSRPHLPGLPPFQG